MVYVVKPNTSHLRNLVFRILNIEQRVDVAALRYINGEHTVLPFEQSLKRRIIGYNTKCGKSTVAPSFYNALYETMLFAE